MDLGIKPEQFHEQELSGLTSSHQSKTLSRGIYSSVLELGCPTIGTLPSRSQTESLSVRVGQAVACSQCNGRV